MTTAKIRSDVSPLETRTLSVGFLLVGLAIALTTVCFVSILSLSYLWLVWGVGGAFAAVALLTFEWPRALRRPGRAPMRGLRWFLLLCIPLAFVLSSQVCGLGLRACNTVCHITNLALIGLGTVTAVRLHRGKFVAPFLIPMIVVGLIPHCVCPAPINLSWHGMLGGVAPTCEMIPLGATLFAVAGLRGVRPRSSTFLVAALFGVMAFIIVGGLLFGFPWQGCVDHPM